MKSLEGPPETLTRSSPAWAATSTRRTVVPWALDAITRSATRSAARPSRNAGDIAAHSGSFWSVVSGLWSLVLVVGRWSLVVDVAPLDWGTERPSGDNVS